MRKLITTLLFALSFIGFANAQYQLGLRLETFAGANSLAINPVGNLNNPNKWDMNLAGGGLYLQNNYAYLEDIGLANLVWHSHSIKLVRAENAETTVARSKVIVDFANDSDRRYLHSMTYVAGPSIALRFGKNNSIGAFYNIRSAIGGKDLPNELSYYKFKSKSVTEQLAIPKLRFSMLNWSEIGLNYARKIPTNTGSFNFGANVKYLLGHQAGLAKSNEPYFYGNLPGTDISIQLPDGQVDFAGELSKSKLLEVNGRGIGADLGFAYIFQDHYGEGYKLKLGASLMDLGRIQFHKNTQVYRLKLDTTVVVDLERYKHYNYPDDLDEAIHDFSQELLKTQVSAEETESFSMSLPAAFSLQVDYGIAKNIYLNALLVQQLPSGSRTAVRSNLLAFTPRWQTKWFSASAPITLNDWKTMRMGLAMRLNWLVLGTDDFASVFLNRKFTGTDYYFAIKINPIKTK
jgi:hypothetical protein